MRVFFVVSVHALLLAGAVGSTASMLAGQSVLPEAPGRDVTVKLCGSCHAAETVASVRLTPDGWRESGFALRNNATSRDSSRARPDFC